MADTNKVMYGLSNAHYSLVTFDENGTPTFGAFAPFPGSVNLSISPEGGEPTPFFADNITYYMSPGANNGYSGDWEVAKVPDEFLINVLGFVRDANGVLFEDAEAVSKTFALAFEFDGDVNKTRHILYNCRASRTDFGSSTIEETAEPQTQTLTITAIPMAFTVNNEKKLFVKAKANQTDSGTQYSAWFNQVYTPASSEA